MGKYRNNLPQLSDKPFLTDGGVETTLMFHNNIDLPCFAAFSVLRNENAYNAIHDYFCTYAKLAKENALGLVLESVTWRASADWAEKLGLTEQETEELIVKGISLLEDVRNKYENENSPMPISGCLGPRGDGYSMSDAMSVEEAQAYHSKQISTLKRTAADLVTALTMTNINEAIGVTKAAKSEGMPVVISFTVETDGRLPSGETLKDAIENVDRETNAYPAYFMINCAHPSHFENVIENGATWVNRLKGLRANASNKSHAELDEATELDEGNPVELGEDYKRLMASMKNLSIFGGCCGTDHRHIGEIAWQCIAGLAS